MIAINLIEETIGRAPFETLCEWCGGVELYIPSSGDGDQAARIVERIGQDAAAKLIAWAGGTRIYIPMLYQVDLMRRREELRAMRARGRTINEIARDYTYKGRYCARNVQRLLAMRDDEIDGIDDSGQLSML